MAPAVHDAIGAKLCQQSGFSMIFLSGYGLAAARLGVPDIGLLTMTEVCDAARAIVRAVDVPLVVDGDTGYGNALNVRRTVLLAQRGMPKRHIRFDGDGEREVDEAGGGWRGKLDAFERADEAGSEGFAGRGGVRD